MNTNPGGSLGDNKFPMPEFQKLDDLSNFLRDCRGYDYTNNLVIPDLISNKRVAELGSGHGYMTIELSRYASKIDGYDVDRDGIKTAIRLSSKFEISNLNFYLFNGYQTDASDGSYETVLSCDVIEHVPDPNSYLKECYRILEKNGMFILTTPNGLIAKKKDYIIKSHSDYHITEYYPAELNSMLASAGFRVELWYSKVNTVSHGYRLSNYEKLKLYIYSKLDKRTRDIMKTLLERKPKKIVNCADSYKNYKVLEMPMEEINDANCDVIIIVARK